MKYYVSLGDIELDKVTAAVQSSNRDISVYDSVGGGKFAVPQNKGLREWTIKCEIDDYDVIKDLDKMQKSKTPVRLVINCEGYKVSERVLLKGYTAPEEGYAGVWPVTLTVIEHVKVGVKTADVPYVAREGNKVLPMTAVLGDGTGGTKTPFQLALEAEQAGLVADGKDLFLGGFVRDDKGRIVYNPVAVPNGTEVNINSGMWDGSIFEDSVWNKRPDFAGNNTLLGMAWTAGDAISSAGSAISNATKYDLPAAVGRGVERAEKAMSDAWDQFNKLMGG